jgi:type VI secretion system protein ImpC
MANPQEAGAALQPQATIDATALTGQLIQQEEGKFKRVFETEDLNQVKQSLQELVSRVLKGKLVKGNLFQLIDQATALLDKMLSDQVNAIMHHPDFRRLEGSWRGLKHLVDNTITGQHIKIRVLNITKAELGSVMDRFSAESGRSGWDQSPMFKQVFSQRFDQPGGEPFGCLVGDYQFDASNLDVILLARMAKVCSAAHAPFISGAAPKIMGLKSWENLPDPASLAEKMADFASWKTLRDSEDSRYLALALPRFMAREPYGAEAPAEGFNFEEDLRPAADEAQPGATAAGESTHDNYVWANSAYALAVNIGRAFYDTGFCVRIRGVESGGKVEGLPVHKFPREDGTEGSKCPTEVSIPQQREAELSRLGFMPLSHYTGTDFAAFIGGQTVQKPAFYPGNDDATANAELSARLPYIFLLSRFAQYLKKMIYDWVGSPMSRDQLEDALNGFAKNYTSAPSAAEDVKEKKPFKEARIEVTEIAGKPGYYQAKAYLVPHIQLEGVAVDLGVVEKLPTPTA